MIERHIVVERNEHGFPTHDSPPCIDVKVTPAESEHVDVEIMGSKEQLVHLAEVLIGVAETSDYHTHIDIEQNGIRWLTIVCVL